MARKKIIFVIVEGISEDTALGVILSRIYDKSTVHVEITRGDITSDKGVTAANVIARTAAFVRRYAAAYYLKKVTFSGSFICLIRTAPTFRMIVLLKTQRTKNHSIRKRISEQQTATVF